MSRSNAILLVVLVLGVWPAFSADPPAGTTVASPPGFEDDDIDPATGLSRSTVVRPLREYVPPETPAAPARATPAVRKRPHIALILPTASAGLGRLADALRQGFAAAREAAGNDAPPVNVTAVEAEGNAALDACRQADATGAMVVVGGLTRDGANTLAASDCTRAPLLALNEVLGPIPRAGVFSVSLSLDHEARQVALQAVSDGYRSAAIVGSASPLSKRVQEAFEREWTNAAGEIRRIAYSGNPEDAPALRERVLSAHVDLVFFALDPPEARAVRPYIPAVVPVYATSLSVNPRAEPLVNVDLQGVRYGEMPWFVQPDHTAVMVYPQPRQSMSVEQERLYALGIDAFRLALLLLRPQGPMQLDGVTGRISLEGDNTFVRTLVPAEVDNGKVVPLHTPP
jgi:uncharacterized protein